MRLTYTAGEGDGGRRVYHILKKELRISAEGIRRLKAAGGVFVGGESVWMDRRLIPGETLEADLDMAERAPDFPAQEGPLEVLYESGALLAVNKPAGMLTHPSRGVFTGTLANLAAGYVRRTGGGVAVHAVNRLDRDTSGVVLFAKNAHFKDLAVKALAQTDCGKVYTAVLWGVLPQARGVIDLPIAREREGFQRRVVREDGKRAVTEYETLSAGEILGRRVSLARLTLRTGRTHQIRVHCSHLGAPVLGDRLYGTAESLALSNALGLQAHLLHAGRLTFQDPITRAPVTVEAPVEREDMRKLLNFFENRS